MGKLVDVEEIENTFGPVLCRVIGRNVINKLELWLQINRRTDATFKPSNWACTELGARHTFLIFFKFVIYTIHTALQRLFAYWPKLDIQMNLPSHRNYSPDKARESCAAGPVVCSAELERCVVRLLWQERRVVNKYFRDILSFEPSFNLL